MRERTKPTAERLDELARLVADPNTVPGPLDREDLEMVLRELIELRARQPKLNETRDLVEAVA